jgi:thioesterase domain-containing protein/acyl carrier protein
LPAPGAVVIPERTYEAPQGEVEEILAEIWQEILEVERVGRNDNFFDLGGHSLLIVILMARLAARLDSWAVELPPAALFEHPTIRQLAELVEQIRSQPSAASANPVALRSTGSKLPLFIVHPASGDVMPYGELAGLVDQDVPVYGLAGMGIEAADSPLRSIEALAAQYVQDIRRVQPSGPYRLSGWSVGGLIAYEMALQLIRGGEAVEFVGMIDTFTPAALADVDIVDDLAILREYVRGEMQEVDETVFEEIAQIEDVAVVVERCKQAGWLPAELGVEQVRGFLDRHRILSQASRTYRPQPLPMPVHLLAADDLPGQDPSRGWAAMMGEQVHITRIGGTHQSMMEQPLVERLAAAISQLLRQEGSLPRLPQASSGSSELEMEVSA